MSKHTVSRIPSHVLQMLRTYESVSTRKNLYSDIFIKKFMQRSTDEYQRFHRTKLFRHNEYKPNDFSIIERKHVDVLFNKPLDLGPIENVPTSEIFIDPKKSTIDDPIYPSYFKTPKNSTDHYAKLLTLFASYYSPYHEVPPITTVTNSFRWYLKLLSNTPVFFVLKQTHRLFSDSSLAQINKPLSDLKDTLRNLARPFVSSVTDDGAVRNYHLTDIASADLLQLAIKNQQKFSDMSTKSFEETMATIDWSECQFKSDGLIEALANRNITITDSQLHSISNQKLDELIETQYFNQALENAQKRSPILFPYDIKYEEFHLVTIEGTILDNNHSALLETLENSEFEIIAVRLSLQHPLIYNFFKENISSSKKPSNYNELLRAAQQPLKTGNFNQLMKGLGELNLVSVEESCNGNSIYLFPKSN